MGSDFEIKGKSIVLFDGQCNLCNRSVDFIIKRDFSDHFYFASLQSDFGRKMIERNFLGNLVPDSILLFENGEVFVRSDAAFRILRRLKTSLKFLMIFYFLPQKIRDFFYDHIAKRRYFIFGKKSTCRVPNASERQKFLDY